MGRPHGQVDLDPGKLIPVAGQTLTKAQFFNEQCRTCRKSLRCRVLHVFKDENEQNSTSQALWEATLLCTGVKHG